MKILAFVVGLALVGVLAYGGWAVSRWLNYFIGYESMVKQTVCDMIKPDHLIKPCDNHIMGDE